MAYRLLPRRRAPSPAGIRPKPTGLGRSVISAFTFLDGRGFEHITRQSPTTHQSGVIAATSVHGPITRFQSAAIEEFAGTRAFPAADFTATFWVRFNDAGGGFNYFATWSAETPGFFFEHTGVSHQWGLRVSGTNHGAGENLSTGVWYRLTYRRTGSTIEFFRDRTKLAGTATESSTLGGTAVIFNGYSSASNGSNPDMVMAVVHDRALSDGEILGPRGLHANMWGWAADRRLPAVFEAAGGAAAALEADVSASATMAAALTTSIDLAAALAASATTSADLTTGIPLAAGISASATTAGDITTGIALAASASSTATTSADLTTGIPLACAVSASATTAADLTTGIPLAAAVDATASVSGTLDGDTSVAADVTASATVSGDLTTGINLAATPSASASVAGDLTTGIPLAGALSASALVSADVTTSIRVTGSLAVTAALAGDITTAIKLAAALSASATTSAALTTSSGVSSAAARTMTIAAEVRTMTIN